jgi:hypothetical protein
MQWLSAAKWRYGLCILNYVASSNLQGTEVHRCLIDPILERVYLTISLPEAIQAEDQDEVRIMRPPALAQRQLLWPLRQCGEVFH